jgi:photosystem II stability/assembly factor-like uncharacterized protein
MKKIFFIIVLFTSHSLISQWFIVNHISNFQFYSLYFTANTIGCVGGNQNGVIFKTTDSGGNFTSVPTGTSIWFLDIFFINSQTGWACGQNGYIVKTTTAGNSWAPMFQAANFLHSIRFVDANTGYSAGFGNLIYKSTNAGINWSILPNSITNTYLLGTSFINANTGCVVGENGLIARTTDGGQIWQTISASTSEYYEEVTFTDANTGYIAGKFGRILKSTNAGLNWTQQTSNTSEWLLDVFFMNNNSGWACGMNGKIIYTSNGGLNWVNQYVPTISWIRQIHFISSDTGYAVTDNGMILKTYNAGNPVGIIPVLGEIPKDFSLSQNHPNPFNPSTKFKFAIPVSSNVSLKLFDNQGREIAVFINSFLRAGVYEYDFDGGALSSGIYFYRLTTETFAETRKMVLVK